MGKDKKTATHPAERAQDRNVAATALKWVGGITAVLSLIFGLHQLVGLISAHRERDRQVNELLKTSEVEERGRDYAAAWKSLEEAERVASGRREVRAAQESLAMDWLENASVNPDQQKFSDITDKLTPVLDRAVASAEGTRKADLLAHLGWAAFLRSRDGASGTVPDDYYRRALAADPQNACAHAMLGHWLLRNGGHLLDAEQQFAQALASGQRREFVRQLQLAGLNDFNSEAAEIELVNVLNAMRKNGEPVDSRTRHAAWSVYYFNLDPGSARRPQFLAALPPTEQLATFNWLFEGAGFDAPSTWLRDFYRRVLEDQAGERAEALRTLLSVRSELPDGAVQRIRDEVSARIARLSKTK